MQGSVPDLFRVSGSGRVNEYGPKPKPKNPIFIVFKIEAQIQKPEFSGLSLGSYPLTRPEPENRKKSCTDSWYDVRNFAEDIFF